MGFTNKIALPSPALENSRLSPSYREHSSTDKVLSSKATFRCILSLKGQDSCSGGLHNLTSEFWFFHEICHQRRSHSWCHEECGSDTQTVWTECFLWAPRESNRAHPHHPPEKQDWAFSPQTWSVTGPKTLSLLMEGPNSHPGHHRVSGGLWFYTYVEQFGCFTWMW